MSTGRGTASDYDWEDGADAPGASDPSARTPADPAALPALPRRGVRAVPSRDLTADVSAWSGTGAGPDATGAASEERPGVPDSLFDIPAEGPYGAPSFTYDAPEETPDEERRDGRLPAWAILAMVAVQGAAAVAIVALVLGAGQNLLGGGAADPSAAPPSAPATRSAPPAQTEQPREPGTVLDAQGREVTDGTGGYDQPATVGEHTVAWSVWTGGTLSVTPQAVDLDATLPGASGEGAIQEGYRLVLVEYEVRYDGTGHLAPAEELWLTGESSRTYFPDVGEGLVPDPMKRITPLADGASARFHSAFVVPEAEVESFRLGVETFSGEVLYFATT